MDMAAGDRSITEVFQNIIGNVQEIVRSEVRLIKTEVKDDANRAKPPLILLVLGGAAALFATLFSLLAIVYALALVLPIWAAALIVGATLAIVASMTISAGLNQFKQVFPPLKKTVEITKENVEWAKQQFK